MDLAERIRSFLSTLFGSKLVVQLRADLDEARRERDYFKGRCERIELAAQMERDRAAQPRVPAVPRSEKNFAPVGPMLWNGVVKKRRAELEEKLKQEQEAKAKAKETN